MLEAIDRVEECVDSAQLRSALGNPSSERWAAFRKAIGLTPDDRGRKLTQYEAVLLIVRKNWKAICRQVGSPPIREPDSIELDTVADRWLLTSEAMGLEPALKMLTAMGNVPSSQLRSVVSIALKKEISTRTIRRICAEKGMPKFGAKKSYSRRQVLKIVAAIASSND